MCTRTLVTPPPALEGLDKGLPAISPTTVLDAARPAAALQSSQSLAGGHTHTMNLSMPQDTDQQLWEQLVMNHLLEAALAYGNNADDAEVLRASQIDDLAALGQMP